MSSRSVLQRTTPYLLLAAMTVVLMMPALHAPPMRYDSFWIDLVWSEQFTAGLRAGVPYPRWLPLSFGGLGAPVFYFYAPLSFYLTGLFGLLGFATYPALLAGFATAWFAAGVTMLGWLRMQRAATPLAGAALYMVLPYHVIDFYARGALAEFCAVALLPLVAMATAHAVTTGRARPLAVAYAALTMTHLPMAVLTGVLMVAPCALWAARADLRRLATVARGMCGAMALAAPYLVPALTLQRHSSLGTLWSQPFLQPGNWSVLHPALWPSTPYVLLFAGLAMFIAIAAAAIGRGRAGIWTGWTIGVCVIVMGLVPGFWSLPVLSAVQFPWRALALAEFGLVTVIALRRGSPVLRVALLLPLLTASCYMLSPENPLNGERMAALPVAGHQDVIEYLPPGMVGPSRAVDRALLARAAALSRHDRQASFPFPSIQARCGDRTAAMRPHPDIPVLVVPPAGCVRTVVMLPAERIGLTIALIALAWLVSPLIRPLARRTLPRPASLTSRPPLKRRPPMADTSRIQEHMNVIGADGVHVGTVDHLDGDRIKLTRTDSGDGKHHYIATGLVAEVEGDDVRLSANADVAISIFEESE